VKESPRTWKDKKKPNTGNFTVVCSLRLKPGAYQVEWIAQSSGETLRTDPIRHEGGPLALTTPPHAQDIALRLRAAP